MRERASEIVEGGAAEGGLWLKELAHELGTEDREEALRALEAVLHALRDSLGVEEVAVLGSHLPTLVRGLYYEGWDPARPPLAGLHDVDAFLEHVARQGEMAGETEASVAVSAVLRVLLAHTTVNETGLLAALPGRVGSLSRS